MRLKRGQYGVFLIAAAVCGPSTCLAQALPELTRAEAFSIQMQALQIVLDTIDIRATGQEFPLLWLPPRISADTSGVGFTPSEVDRLREIAPTLRFTPRSREELFLCPDAQPALTPPSVCRIAVKGVIVGFSYPRSAEVFAEGSVDTLGAEVVVDGSVWQTSLDGERTDLTGIVMGFRKQADEWVFVGVLAWVIS